VVQAMEICLVSTTHRDKISLSSVLTDGSWKSTECYRNGGLHYYLVQYVLLHAEGSLEILGLNMT
jgi:hypothetical protein